MGFMEMSRVLGADQLGRSFSTLGREASREAGNRIFALGEEILTDAVRLAPVEFGRLRGSARVKRDADDAVILSFGTDYALFVHEIPPPFGGGPKDPPQWRPGTRRARHAAPTQWKFLEKPARQHWERIADSFSGTDDLLHTVTWPTGGLR